MKFTLIILWYPKLYLNGCFGWGNVSFPNKRMFIIQCENSFQEKYGFMWFCIKKLQNNNIQKNNKKDSFLKKCLDQKSGIYIFLWKVKSFCHNICLVFRLFNYFVRSRTALRRSVLCNNKNQHKIMASHYIFIIYYIFKSYI